MNRIFINPDDPFPDIRGTFAHLPTLTTTRLILRPMRWRDAKDIFAFAKDPEVARYVLWSAHINIWDTYHYIHYMKRLYRQGEPSSFAIALRETGQVIGTIGFMSYSSENSTVEVGYSLSRSFWGKGIMPEALQQFLSLCFDTLHINRVEAMYDRRNPSSGRVMEKCGMTFEGTLRSKVCNKGEFADVNLRAIIRADWDNMHT